MNTEMKIGTRTADQIRGQERNEILHDRVEIALNQETIMSLDDIQKRLTHAGNVLDLARANVAGRRTYLKNARTCLKTAEEEESRLSTAFKIVFEERDAAVRAAVK